jgi:hypothetical protein
MKAATVGQNGRHPSKQFISTKVQTFGAKIIQILQHAVNPELM